jgi:hypothetical protein
MRGVEYDFSEYSMVLAQLTSLLSGSVVLSVWPLQWRSQRRKKLRKGIGFALYALILVIVIISNYANNKSDWDIQCFHFAGTAFWSAMSGVMYFAGAAFILQLLAACSRALSKRFEIFRNCLPSLQLPADAPIGWIVAFFGLTSTWTLFGFF